MRLAFWRICRRLPRNGLQFGGHASPTNNRTPRRSHSQGVFRSRLALTSFSSGPGKCIWSTALQILDHKVQTTSFTVSDDVVFGSFPCVCISCTLSAALPWNEIMQPTPSSPHKSSPPNSSFAHPPFSKNIGEVLYPLLQYEETLPHLSVKRLNSISSHLWLAGRPQADHLRKSTLHQLNATGFHLVILEDADLHLLWKNNMIYIKPLPSCLLNFDFWQENICSSTEDCDPDQAGRSCDFTGYEETC
jgi:hypothetical protein